MFNLLILGVDEECEPCMRFYREGLTVSFMKILTDEAVNSWKYNIHYCILNSCVKFMQLCALHLKRDNSFLLELLSVVLDPDNKFNTFNISRQSTSASFVGLNSNAKNENSILLATTVNTTSSTSTITTQSISTPSGEFDELINDRQYLISENRLIIFFVTISVSQTQSGSDELSSIVSSSTTPTTTSKVNTSPVNTTVSLNNVNSSKQSPVQQRSNELINNTMATSRNQLNNSTMPNAWSILTEDQIYAKSPPDPHHPRGWLVDLINKYE